MQVKRCGVFICRVGYRGARLVFIALVAYGCVSLLIDTAFYFYDTSFVAPFSNNTEQIYERLRQENPSQTFQVDGNNVNLTLVEEVVARYRFDLDTPLPEGEGDPWALAEQWVTDSEVLPDYAPELGAVLKAMVTAPIVSIGPTNGGQQPKFNITLKGGQIALFKPTWWKRDRDWEGDLCLIPDNPSGEVASFHLSRVLDFRRTPLAVGRTLNVSKEVLPLVATGIPGTFFKRGNKTCFFFDCPQCKKKRSLCVGDTMEGVVILWLPTAISHNIQVMVHPWGRPCRDQLRKHPMDVAQYLKDDHCEQVRQDYPFSDNDFFLDLVDASIFQYLTTNADRFLFQLFDGDSVEQKMMVMLDNGKTFQHPDRDEPRVLAPLYQCCFVRITTYERLLLLAKGVLSRVMKAVLSADPLSPVLTDRHLIALDRRLEHVLYEIEKCLITHKPQEVLAFWTDSPELNY